MSIATFPPREALAKLTRDELYTLATEAGITVPKSITKVRLLDALAAADSCTERPDCPLHPVGAAHYEDDDGVIRPGIRPAVEPVRAPIVDLMRQFLTLPGAMTAEERGRVESWKSPEQTPDQFAEWLRRSVAEYVSPAEAGPAQREPDPIPDSGIRNQDGDGAGPGVELEPWSPQQRTQALLPSSATWEHIQRMATDLAGAVALPGALRNKPADVALVLLTGRDLGIAPTVALNKIHVIDGRPSMAAELMRALVIDRGHDVWFAESSDERATCCIHRSNWPADRVASVTFTLADAGNASLLGKDNWKKYPRPMLKARATSECLRDNAPDVLLGVSYTPEELGADVDEAGEPVRITSTATTEPVPTDDERARRDGWESYEAEKAAHLALHARIREHLAGDQLEQARQMRAEHGWPMRPKKQFDAFALWVETTISAAQQEKAPPAADGTHAERLAEAARVLAEAEATTRGDGLASGEVLMQVCGTCGAAGETYESIDHAPDCPERPF